MRYSTAKLLYYILEEVDEAKKKRDEDEGKDVEIPSGIQPPENVENPEKVAPPSKKDLSDTPSALIDPKAMGEKTPEDVKSSAELGARTSMGGFGVAKMTPGGAEGLIGKSGVDVARDVNANMFSRLEREMQAHQEASRGMANVSNFYKNLGLSAPIPLRTKSDLGLLGSAKMVLQHFGYLPKS